MVLYDTQPTGPGLWNAPSRAGDPAAPGGDRPGAFGGAAALSGTRGSKRGSQEVAGGCSPASATAAGEMRTAPAGGRKQPLPLPHVSYAPHGLLVERGIPQELLDVRVRRVLLPSSKLVKKAPPGAAAAGQAGGQEQEQEQVVLAPPGMLALSMSSAAQQRWLQLAAEWPAEEVDTPETCLDLQQQQQQQQQQQGQGSGRTPPARRGTHPADTDAAAAAQPQPQPPSKRRRSAQQAAPPVSAAVSAPQQRPHLLGRVSQQLQPAPSPGMPGGASTAPQQAGRLLGFLSAAAGSRQHQQSQQSSPGDSLLAQLAKPTAAHQGQGARRSAAGAVSGGRAGSLLAPSSRRRR
jgi:hypothetical protein